ncbi:hypothetical protein [Microcystis phage Mel-JY01]
MPIKMINGSGSIYFLNRSNGGSVLLKKETPPPPQEPIQILLNSEFTTGSTHWTASGTFGTFSTNNASRPAVYQNTLVFSYSDAAGIVSQTVDVSQNIQTYDEFNSVMRIRHIQNTSPWGSTSSYSSIDKFYFMVEFFDTNNIMLINKRIPPSGTENCPRYYTEYSLSLNRNEIVNFNDIRYVKVTVFGDDTAFWNGNYGPQVDYIRLYVI